MNNDQLITHLKQEIKRVKEQRNDYEQRWMKAVRELNEVIKLYDLPSYVEISKKHLKKLTK